jgi:opine dehydrogenase
MRQRCSAKVVIGESSTLLFTGRLHEANRVMIGAMKKQVSFATLPARMTAAVAAELSVLCEFKPVDSVLATSLENLGPAFHVVGMLLNTGVIERGLLEVYYRDGVTPAVARVMEKVDAERLELASALGVDVRSAASVVSEGYEIKAAGLYEAIHGNRAYVRIGGVPGLDFRYLTDDLPASVVPMVALSQAIGLPAPLLRACVTIGSAVLDRDFWSSGRTLESMGLSGMGKNEIKCAARDGLSVPSDREVRNR